MEGGAGGGNRNLTAPPQCQGGVSLKVPPHSRVALPDRCHLPTLTFTPPTPPTPDYQVSPHHTLTSTPPTPDYQVSDRRMSVQTFRSNVWKKLTWCGVRVVSFLVGGKVRCREGW